MTIRSNVDPHVRELERKASQLADQVINRSYAGAYMLNLTFGVTKEGRSFPLINAIDQILQVTPNNPDVLFAKAEIYSLLRDDKTGQRLRREVLRLEPNHFDAYMREYYFKDWENIFTYPGWSEDMTKVPPVMLAVRNSGQFVQIVRDGLTLTLAILVSVNRQHFPPELVDARWKPFWIDTPFGPVFPHYAMFRLPNGKIYRQEYSLSPYSSTIHQRNGNWLIRRFCEIDSIFIVVNEVDDVIFNFRFVYTESVRNMLASVKEKLMKMILPSDHETKIQKAMQWYMENSDIETVPY